MCRQFREDFGLETRVARYHNVYGPQGTYDGGREKAPAAICRKVIEAKLSGNHEIEIWGDGHQTRSFMWIDDCVKGTQMIMDSDFAEPLNLGSSELVSINQLVDMVEEIGGVKYLQQGKDKGQVCPKVSSKSTVEGIASQPDSINQERAKPAQPSVASLDFF